MREHIKAWKNEHRRSLWEGHYSLEVLDSSCKGRLLDAGCGSGKYALPLRMRGFDVVAVDISHHALRTAADRSARHRLDIDFLAANIYELPFADCSFDAVWCYGVLQHFLLEERERTIDEFRRILRKDGLLFIEVFGEADMRYGGCEVEHNTFCRKNDLIYHYFNKNELEELLHGFSCRITESRKEKRFDGRDYTRHMLSAIAKKS